MRLWVLTNEYKPFIIGGLGIVATELTKAIANSGADVTVYSGHSSSEVSVEQRNAIQIIRFPKMRPYYSRHNRMFLPSAISGWSKENDTRVPQLIHVHSVQFGEVAAHFKKTFDIPVIYTCHSLVVIERKTTIIDPIAKRQEKLLGTADVIVVPSEWQRNKVKQYYPFCDGKIHVIENGIHVKEVGEIESGPRHRLLYIGRLVRSKGIEELLHALSLLAKTNRHITLDVVGSGTAAYASRLRALARKYGIQSRVRWHGFQKPKAVQKLYPLYGMLIVPSHHESFGLVALEALANRIPLAATRAGGLSCFVNEEVAEVIPAVSGPSIAAAVRKIWRNKELTKKRIEMGYHSALQYSWSGVCSLYRDLFLSYLPAGRGKDEQSEMEA